MTEAMLYARLKELLGADFLPDLIDLCSEYTQIGYRTRWVKVADMLSDYLASKIYEELHPVAAPDATGHP